MANWLYQGKELTEVPEGYIGFVYKITRIDSKGNPEKIYIGKKNFFSTRNIPITKKELAEIKGPGRNRKKKKVVKESDWQKYYGSDKNLIEDVKKLGGSFFKREIIMLCKSKKGLSYYEVKYQIIEEVLEKDTYNGTILGKFFRKDLE
jgi:hypothetical protein